MEGIDRRYRPQGKGFNFRLRSGEIENYIISDCETARNQSACSEGGPQNPHRPMQSSPKTGSWTWLLPHFYAQVIQTPDSPVLYRGVLYLVACAHKLPNIDQDCGFLCDILS